MGLIITILGCASSGGVPRIGPDWGACDPAEPRNRRRRCALLVERHSQHGTTRILVDTGPDLREQLLGAGVDWVDAVLYTHDHADHVHGIDDLRMLYLRRRQRVKVYMAEDVRRRIEQRFGYCFVTPPGSPYEPILHAHSLSAGQVVSVEGAGGEISVLPFSLSHGTMDVFGFRFGDIAYAPDVSDIPRQSLSALSQLHIWIVDALRYMRHPSHFNLEQALGWVARMEPREAILTNMHVDLDYQALCQELPAHVRPAYDGMVVEGGTLLPEVFRQ